MLAFVRILTVSLGLMATMTNIFAQDDRYRDDSHSDSNDGETPVDMAISNSNSPYSAAPKFGNSLLSPVIVSPLQYHQVQTAVAEVSLNAIQDQGTQKGSQAEVERDTQGSQMELLGVFNVNPMLTGGLLINYKNADTNREVDGIRTSSINLTSMSLTPSLLFKLGNNFKMTVGYYYQIDEYDNSELDIGVRDTTIQRRFAGLGWATSTFELGVDYRTKVDQLDKGIVTEVPREYVGFFRHLTTDTLTLGLAYKHGVWSEFKESVFNATLNQEIERKIYDDESYGQFSLEYLFAKAKFEMVVGYRNTIYNNKAEIAPDRISYYLIGNALDVNVSEKSRIGFQIEYKVGQDIADDEKVAVNAFSAGIRSRILL